MESLHLRPFLLAMTLLACLFSCSDDSDELRRQIADLQATVEQLRQAASEARAVSRVDMVEGGYAITFADGTVVSVTDSHPASAPMLTIDAEGYWTVSYDGGVTYGRVLDAGGKPVSASVSLAGAYGMRVIVNADGFYAFEIYHRSSPEVTEATIVTEIKPREGTAIQSIVRDDATGVLTMTMADGTVFSFNLDVSYPTGIVVVTESVTVTAGSEGDVRFRLNPSDASVAWVTEGEDANLRLDDVTSAGSRASYIHEPAGLRIVDVRPDYAADGTLLQGQYVARIASSGLVDAPQLRLCLVLSTRNGAGQSVDISSQPFTAVCGVGTLVSSVSVDGHAGVYHQGSHTFHVKLPYGIDVSAMRASFVTNALSVTTPSGESVLDLRRPQVIEAKGPDGAVERYTVAAHYSDLPIIYIDTPVDITSKDRWTEGCTLSVYNAGGDNVVFTDAQLKGRGNSTWGQPKKPYAIKLASAAPVLGMPAHKRWVLLADWFDTSHLRNELGFYLSSELSRLDYTPRRRYAEVVVNGDYAGLYLFTEQIGLGSSRVDTGEGGVLLEVDSKAAADDLTIEVAGFENKINIKEPDMLAGSAELLQVKQRLEDCVASLGRGFPQAGELIHFESWIDWYIISELLKNMDSDLTTSCFMHYSPTLNGGRLTMGPMWDFDSSAGNARAAFGHGQQWLSPEGMWTYRPDVGRPAMLRLMLDYPDFKARVRERFAFFSEHRDQIARHLLQQQENIKEARDNDRSRWGLNDSESDARKLVEWLDVRFAWLEANLAR